MGEEQLNQYTAEKDVDFKGEKYLVRNNGAVYRKYRPDRRRSSGDEIWTFGREAESSRYMYIGSHEVHRIVASAFHGSAPSKRHVVDHIDRNRSNNRPENLRWITGLENVLRHPSTRKHIIDAYGSIDNFLENPDTPTKLVQEIVWLRTVSKEEVKNSWEQVLKWADSEGRLNGNRIVSRVVGTIAPRSPIIEPVQERPSLTRIAVQRKWKTPTEFPSCPNALGPDPLAEYTRNLPSGAVFSRDKYKECLVVMAEQGDALLSVLVRSQEDHAIKPWAVTKVTIENGKFVHEAIGMFFDENGAKKEHCKLLDMPFSGESFDDYC